MDPTEQTASVLLRELATDKVRACDATQAYLDRAAKVDPAVRAYLTLDEEGALRKAREIDARRSRGEPLGRLAGVPIAVKDVLCTAGLRTTCASRMLDRFVPPYDATVVTKLQAADAVLLGKLNMDEFAMGGSNENSGYHPTRNPWNLDHVPGGSSGGSAACVAARMAPWTLGSDTGGSVRQPASFCGVVGLKPTYGRVSRFGLVAFASSLDQVGPLATRVSDAALLLEIIAGHDVRDSTSMAVPVPQYTQSVDRPLETLRLGIVREHFAAGLDPEVEKAVREAVRVFESRGAKVHEVSLPHAKYAVATYYVIACCEASSNLARYDGAHYGYRTDEAEMRAELVAEAAALKSQSPGADDRDLDSPLVRMYRRSRAEGFGPEVKRRIMLGTYALSAGYYDAYYLQALKVRRLIRRDFDEAFRKVDLLIGPVAPRPAYRIGEKANDPLAMYLEDIYTVSANLAGICAISVPCGFSAVGLPIGLQLQGPPFGEETLLRAAAMFERATDWHLRKPDLGDL